MLTRFIYGNNGFRGGGERRRGRNTKFGTILSRGINRVITLVLRHDTKIRTKRKK